MACKTSEGVLGGPLKEHVATCTEASPSHERQCQKGRRNEHGTILLTLSLCLVAMVAAVGLAIDVGRIYIASRNKRIGWNLEWPQSCAESNDRQPEPMEFSYCGYSDKANDLRKNEGRALG